MKQTGVTCTKVYNGSDWSQNWNWSGNGTVLAPFHIVWDDLIWAKISLQLQDFTFSQQYCWRFNYSQTWHCVTGWVVHSVWKVLQCFETSGITHSTTQRHIADDTDILRSCTGKLQWKVCHICTGEGSALVYQKGVQQEYNAQLSEGSTATLH